MIQFLFMPETSHFCYVKQFDVAKIGIHIGDQAQDQQNALHKIPYVNHFVGLFLKKFMKKYPQFFTISYHESQHNNPNSQQNTN